MKEVSVCLEKPTSEQYENVCNELDEDQDRFETALKIFNEWARCQVHLPQNIDPEYFPVFLRGCKHDLERAKRKLDNYYTARATFSELFENRDPLSNDHIAAAKTFKLATLPKLTSSGHRVTFHKFADVDASQFIPKDVFRLNLLLADVRILEEKPIAGDIFVFDLQHMSAGHCTRLAQPVLLSRMLTVVQQAYPQRLAHIHLINAPSYLNNLIILFKSFMTEKMKNRFTFHYEKIDLNQILPKDCIPEDYGGSLPTLEQLHDAWQQKLVNNRDWILKQKYFIADNNKRVEKNNNSPFCQSNEIFGAEGAFRKLNID